MPGRPLPLSARTCRRRRPLDPLGDHTALGTALWERANIRVHLGKTRAWNAAGEETSALLDALPAAPRADAWAGSWARPPAQQGITVLGTPLGHAAYIAGALRRVREKHDELLGRIPAVPHLQSAWLLLLLCAQPRSNYLLRVLPPADTGEFAESHDRAIARCLGRLLSGTDKPFELSQLQAKRAQLPLRYGGLGLRSAAASRAAAYWASWADAMPVTGERHPRVLARMLMGWPIRGAPPPRLRRGRRPGLRLLCA